MSSLVCQTKLLAMIYTTAKLLNQDQIEQVTVTLASIRLHNCAYFIHYWKLV